MIAYEFYWLDPIGRYQKIGVLPERRKNTTRITKESIRRWGKNVFGKNFDTKDIFPIEVTIDESSFRISHPIPFTTS